MSRLPQNTLNFLGSELWENGRPDASMHRYESVLDDKLHPDNMVRTYVGHLRVRIEDALTMFHKLVNIQLVLVLSLVYYELYSLVFLGTKTFPQTFPTNYHISLNKIQLVFFFFCE